MKKLVALLLAIVMVVGLFAGCNTEKPVETKPQETQGGTNKPAETKPAETETEAAPETTVDTEGATEQETVGDTDGGCASVVSVTLGVLPLAIAAAFALRKKKD